MDINSIIAFAHGNLTDWRGLASNLLIPDLVKIFNEPTSVVDSTLGYYPASRYEFSIDNGKAVLVAFARQGHVVLLESQMLPDRSLLKDLPEPDVKLPNEILLDNAYASEYVYASRGLNLTVAKYFTDEFPDEIVRCRGFEKLNHFREFDTRYYKSFDDIKSW